MQEFDLSLFNDFIKELLYNLMTDDDYTLVMDELGFPNPHGTNPIMYKTGCHNIDFSQAKYNLAYYPESRSFYCFSECNKSFNLLDLVKQRFELIGESKTTFKCVKWICEKCNIPFDFSSEENKVIEYDWKRDLYKYRKGKKKEVREEIILDDSILNYFQPIYHQSWIDDHITIETMQKYEIGYYPYLDAITIPTRNMKGDLVGVRGRFLNPNSEHKYCPIFMLDGTKLSFPTNDYLWGIWHTKVGIRKHRKVVLGESEKFVQQCESYYGEDNYSVGGFGRAFSDIKRNMILSLEPTEVIIAHDFDYDKVGDYVNGEWVKTKEFEKFEEFIMKTANYFKGYCKVTALVSYSGHKLKDCATDNGKEWYEELYKNREVIYE